MSYKKAAPYQKKMDMALRIERTKFQVLVMQSAIDGKRVQIFANNGAWLTANYESGFGCGWNWQTSVYRVHPEDDTENINAMLHKFYVDPAIVYEVTEKNNANKALDRMSNYEFKKRYEREP